MNEPLTRVITALSGLSLLAKVVLGVGALVLVVGLCSGVAGLVSHWKDARFDKAEAERATERAREQTITDEAIKRAEAAEARAAELEPRVEAQKQVIEELSKRVGISDAKVQEVTDDLVRERDRIGAMSDAAVDAYIRQQLAERRAHR